MTKPLPCTHRRRPLLLTLVGALLLAGCSGADDEEGVATARGVDPTFCQALGKMLVTAKVVKAGTGTARVPRDVVKVGLERDIKAVLDVVPDDAPGELTAFLGGLREVAELSQVWDNPATGGIKEEYVDDFQRLAGVLFDDPPKVVGLFVAERRSGTAVADEAG